MYFYSWKYKTWQQLDLTVGGSSEMKGKETCVLALVNRIKLRRYQHEAKG